MSTLGDTNILLRGAQPSHPMHASAVAAVNLLAQSGEQLCLVPQNLYEFWAVATRPVAANGLGLSVAEAAAEIVRIKQIFVILDDVAAIRPEWERLLIQYSVVGKSAHDARLVAAMTTHGIGRILTFNSSDFQRYPGITVVTPDDVLQANP